MRALLPLLGALFLLGLFATLLPEGWPGPDLFLAYALWYAGARPYFLGLPVAFALGLLQDLLGFGLLGLHGVGLLMATYAHYAASRRVVAGEALGMGLAFLYAFLAKWAGYFLVAYWLRLEPPPLALGSLLLEGALTLPFYLLLRRL
ncbi:rod shape-determining protein MreD [Thermus oshimai]|jgi:rod shape-determining protein MreD|uniref:Rod shape-determining protein MreD n=1 Tax=Thermus oshimai JL-2 TaxID=751945 RepID=K7R5P4_THEOS|nr:hypothetical protein [Thermus oshimai]AFV76249.1 hypothetical protein Theos_1208 [Thermus oshimai JL-2]